MSLTRYNEKRSFDETPEPAGKTRRATHASSLRFVVQKHAASHLHYDFRLELNGVLLSWAVPKGPSLNPGDKRLAMHVEDHPLDYRSFEGIIPKGNYGAGTVMVWDEGTWHGAAPGKTDTKQLSEDYRKGKLTFVLEGKKLHGEYSLVKMHGKGREDNAWLLIKADDEAADYDQAVVEQDRSAVSGRTLEEIAANKTPAKTPGRKIAAKKKASEEITGTKVASKPARKAAAAVKDQGLAQAALALGGKRSARPEISGPQLATLVDEPFDREGWIFEIKWDGYRALGHFPPAAGTTLVSRNGLSFDGKFADIVVAMQSLPCSALLDGEVVALDKDGHSSFGMLQQHQEKPASLVYCVFDLLYVDGVDIRGLPLQSRKQLLQRLLENCDQRLQYSDHVQTFGKDFFELARKNNLEGIIAKDATAIYYPRRTHHWLKIKLDKHQEFIIAGYTAPRQSRSDIGSLVLAYQEGSPGRPTGRLRYAGHVGTGMDTRMRATLKQKLNKLARKTSAFAEVPPTNEAATWVKPQLVCEVRYTEKTADGQLRHPVFLGLREDKAASDVFWDVAAPAEAASESAETETAATQFGKEAPARAGMLLKIDKWEVAVSHPDRLYFPELKLTKMDVINYYRSVAPVLLPYLKDRPFVLHRFPRGIVDDGFYQKDNPQDLPDWIQSTAIRAESTGEEVRYVLCQNEATLVYLINLGCLEMHPWNSRVNKIDQPDWMIFDLDPVDIGFAKVVEVAQVIHAVFTESKVPHYCKTSGKRGLHIAVPLGAKYPHAVVRDMAEGIAQLVHQELPGITSLERSPANRRKKVYLDYLQNGIGKTLVAPYSLRPVEYAGVSTPLCWDELTPALDPRQFTVATTRERIARVGDLWQEVLTKAIDLRKLIRQPRAHKA